MQGSGGSPGCPYSSVSPGDAALRAWAEAVPAPRDAPHLADGCLWEPIPGAGARNCLMGRGTGGIRAE